MVGKYIEDEEGMGKERGVEVLGHGSKQVGPSPTNGERGNRRKKTCLAPTNPNRRLLVEQVRNSFEVGTPPQIHIETEVQKTLRWCLVSLTKV